MLRDILEIEFILEVLIEVKGLLHLLSVIFVSFQLFDQLLLFFAQGSELSKFV